MLDRIEEPAPADGIAGLGYTDALVERSGAGARAGKAKIAHHPAISLMIIKDEPIAIVEARTRRSYQGQEERVVGRSIWAIERVPILIKNLDRAIDRLDIVIRSDIAIRVRWQTHTTALACVHAIESQQRRRHRRRGRCDLLHYRFESRISGLICRTW